MWGYEWLLNDRKILMALVDLNRNPKLEYQPGPPGEVDIQFIDGAVRRASFVLSTQSTHACLPTTSPVTKSTTKL